jgi:molybdate transport system ATP-binding protein
MAVMQDLQLVIQGPVQQLVRGQLFQSIVNRVPAIPDHIPPQLVRKDKTDDLEPYVGPLIELDGVSAGYAELAVLHNINWTMEQHHHVVIEGPNGCGKSTLLSLIDGENHKGYGQAVFLFGRRKGSGETVWDIKARFGVVSNELHNKYVKGWKVLDVVVSGFFDSVGLYDESGTGEWERARQWLATLGIAQLQKRYYHEISFGQQRLVLLARAMVKHPSVLILDEPCVGLDDYHRQLILQTLDVIAAQSNTRIVYVSHVIGEQPTCINQKLSFVPSAAGGFSIEQGSV